jgi:hypothetical protein
LETAFRQHETSLIEYDYTSNDLVKNNVYV